MSEIISLNRLRDRFLDAHETLAILRRFMEDLAEETSQEKVNDITAALLDLDNRITSIKNCITTCLKEVTDEEVTEIDVEPGENGNKIL